LHPLENPCLGGLVLLEVAGIAGRGELERNCAARVPLKFTSNKALSTLLK